MKVLHIFDFDDTLVSSDSNVVINHKDGTQSVLSSDEYATYDEAPGDDIDFSDFDKYPENAVIIGPVFSELLKAISRDGKDSVAILTARENPVPVKDFLFDNAEHFELARETASVALAPKFVLFSLPSKSSNTLSMFF